MRHIFQQQKNLGLISLTEASTLFCNFEICLAPVSKLFLPVSTKKTNKSKMKKKNRHICKYALNKLKIAEHSLKSKLNFLQSAFDQRKNFRSFTVLINKAKVNVDELKTTLDAVLKERPHSSSTSSLMERYSNPLLRLEKFEPEIDSLGDDGLLRQSSSRIRDDVSVTTHTTARCPIPRRCSPSMNEIPETSNPERSSFFEKNTTSITETEDNIPVFV